MQELNENLGDEKKVNNSQSDEQFDAAVAEKVVEVEKIEEKSINKSDTLSFRRPLSAVFRYALIGVAALTFIAASVVIYLANKPHTKEVENIIYTYEFKSEVGYGVKLLPNTVFAEEWQPEGNVYPIKLTDLISIHFDSTLRVSNGSKLSGDYTIEAVLNAFQASEQATSAIYEKKYRLSEGKIDNVGEATMSKMVEVKPADFAALVAQIEEEMGGTTEKELNVVFSGTVYIEDEQYPKEKSFVQKIALPIKSSDVYYSIKKPEAINDFEKVATTNTITIKDNKIYVYFAVGLLAIGVLLLLVVFLLTKNPTEEELRFATLKRMMKKYEERIIMVSSLPSLNYLTILEIFDFEAMVNHSEDIRELILVQNDGNNLPLDNKFYLFGKDKVFVYEEKFEK